jgi:hypothetical protein
MSDDVSVTYEAWGRFGGHNYGRTEAEALAARDQADAGFLARAEASARAEQEAIDRDLAAGKSYAQITNSAVVHNISCPMVRGRLDRAAAWRTYVERMENDPGGWSVEAAPRLYHRHEIEAIPRTRRRCEVCAPDIENWKKPSRRSPGDVVETEMRSVSLAAHHAGRALVLPDGTEAGDLEEVYISVKTSTGIYRIERDAKVMTRHVIPE